MLRVFADRDAFRISVQSENGQLVGSQSHWTASREQHTQPSNVWRSLADAGRYQVAFDKSLLFYLGLYGWEWIVTLNFELSFFKRETRPEWGWHYVSLLVWRMAIIVAHVFLPAIILRQ